VTFIGRIPSSWSRPLTVTGLAEQERRQGRIDTAAHGSQKGFFFMIIQFLRFFRTGNTTS
jgi:hypothetical protein